MICRLVLLLVPAANVPSVKSIVHDMESRYHHARTLQAQFYEQYTDGHGGGAAESGVVYFSRPDRMRWEYESPQQKLFLVDGTNVWYYVPADKVASRARIRQSDDWRTPIAFLAGKLDLGKFCKTIELADPESDSSVAPLVPEDSVLQCVPRSGSSDSPGSIQLIFFEVQPSGYLARILIRQPGNAQIEFRFGNWKEDIPIEETMFHFSPPSGVSIVDEESLLQSVQ